MTGKVWKPIGFSAVLKHQESALYSCRLSVGMDGISQVIQWLVVIFQASIALGHVLRAWRMVRVVYFPKQGKAYTRDFIILPPEDAGNIGR